MFSLDLTLVFHYPPIRQEIFQKRQIKNCFFNLTQPNLSLSLIKILNPYILYIMIIAVDFDGTIVEHRYPEIGREIPFAVETLKKLAEEHHLLILWSVREGKLLDDAVEWCRARGLEFYAVNKDFPEEDENKNRHFSRKLKADMFIDDRNIGGLPDWGTIYKMIHEKKTLEQILMEELNDNEPSFYQTKKKKRWWF